MGSAEHILGTSDLRCLMYIEIECRQHRPSEADCRSADHSISRLLWSPKFHCLIQEFRHLSLDSPDESTLSHSVSLRSVTISHSHMCPGLPHHLFCRLHSWSTHTCYMICQFNNARSLYPGVLKINYGFPSVRKELFCLLHNVKIGCRVVPVSGANFYLLQNGHSLNQTIKLVLSRIGMSGTVPPFLQYILMACIELNLSYHVFCSGHAVRKSNSH